MYMYTNFLYLVCVISQFLMIRKQFSKMDMYNLVYIVHVHQLTNNSPLGSNFTESMGASWPCRVYILEESEISTTLMINSADPAARWVWLELTSRHVTGAVNLISRPSDDPWVKGGIGWEYSMAPQYVHAVYIIDEGFQEHVLIAKTARNYICT